ncbi:GAF and ANTAR domain-containing protein [Catenuloplanes indicus]|uniref:Transcriptional regulator with GAF, ATPase, and Fis domain n=1 Tax=Catenuloplanes indicus TaxID=137267 RepID=A0AAE3VUU4_9ACTN|nr:GAF and ANTAR domain-containing protein [Catenuloplanes indicus]MDQ0364136.1 transcriptional regulator with GAF, ATPase, and Fis domain [Catenuloplanes indicus]
MAEQTAHGRSRGGQGQPSIDYTGRGSLNDLAAQMGEMARSLQQEDSLQDTLDGIVAAAVQTVPGADYAGLMVVYARRRIDTPSATDEVVQRVDHAQYESGEGPCLDAMYRQQTVRLSDMATEHRWPDFSRRAVDLGIRSMLSFQLYVVAGNLGALNLYSRSTKAFDDESEHIGLLFAAHAAVAMAGAQREQHLTNAISVRDVIGQAKGILMERHNVTADQAFQLLVRVSQNANVKLVDVARHLTRTGQLGDPGDG